MVKDGGAAILAALPALVTGPAAPAPSPAPTPAPVDTRDAQIAALKSQVTDLTGQIATLKAQGASLAADLTAAQGKAATASTALATALKDIDLDRAALAAIRTQSQAALDSNLSGR